MKLRCTIAPHGDRKFHADGIYETYPGPGALVAVRDDFGRERFLRVEDGKAKFLTGWSPRNPNGELPLFTHFEVQP